MANVGWIKIHRKIQECWIWQEKPFDKGRAWVDLILLAMHRDKKLLIDNEVVVIERGSFMTSVLKLADRWGWSRNKVLRFLDVLESEQMLNTKRTPKGTLVTIVKYEDYQVGDTTDDTTDEPPLETPNETTDEPQKKNIKNIKNIKNNNINNRGKSFVPPSVDEVRVYCSERNNKVDAQAFVDFYSSKGWMIGKNKMKDWKAAVRTWEKSNNQKSKSDNNKFNSFQQRDYSFDELEKKLISNNK